MTPAPGSPDLLLETRPLGEAPHHHGMLSVRRGSILLLDDDESVRLTLAAVLRADGHKVTDVAGDQAAYTALEAERYDVLVCDLHLGQEGDESNGLQVLRQARDLYPDVICIVVTGYGSLQSAIKALQAGVFGYLLKPCNLDELKAAIESGLERKAAAEAVRRAELAQAAQAEAERAAERLARLQTIATELTGTLSPGSVLDQIVSAAAELLESPVAGLFLARVSRGDFELAASKGLDPESSLVLPRRGSVAGRVMLSRQAAAINDVRKVARVVLPTLVGGRKVGALVVAPIIAGKEELGVIEVYHPEARDWLPEDANLLAALGATAAVAVANSRLYEATRQAVLTRDQVMTTVSHDLKNPLSSISLLSQMLEQKLSQQGTAPAREVLLERVAAIHKVSRNMSAVLDELADAVRGETGQRMDLNPAPTDLAAVVRDVAGGLQGTSDQHRISVEAPGSLTGWWDRARVLRVVQNLMSNAIKYSPKGGTVTVTLRRHGDEAILTVTDQGMGIPKADVPHVFEPFRRGSNVDKIAGTGIGLASVKQVVDQHGGRVTVHSEFAKGSTVHRPSASCRADGQRKPVSVLGLQLRPAARRAVVLGHVYQPTAMKKQHPLSLQ